MRERVCLCTGCTRTCTQRGTRHVCATRTDTHCSAGGRGGAHLCGVRCVVFGGVYLPHMRTHCTHAPRSAARIRVEFAFRKAQSCRVLIWPTASEPVGHAQISICFQTDRVYSIVGQVLVRQAPACPSRREVVAELVAARDRMAGRHVVAVVGEAEPCETLSALQVLRNSGGGEGRWDLRCGGSFV